MVNIIVESSLQSKYVAMTIGIAGLTETGKNVGPIQTQLCVHVCKHDPK